VTLRGQDACVPQTKFLAAGYIAFATVDAVLAGRPGTTARRLRFATKPALMPTLAAATRAAASQGRPSRGLGTAQALSWGGDVALLGAGESAFLAGLGAFFGAHLAYISTLARRGDRITVPPNQGVKAALALWLSTAPAMTFAARRTDRDLAVPVAAYATALAAMFATAGRLDPALSRNGRRAVQAGAALFLLSDTVLGMQQFVLRRRVPALETVVMATYTAGQGLIAAGATNL
jgi:uncharacterized membrane protein YhhN